MNFKELELKLADIVSEWDGKDKGILEERAIAASDAMVELVKLERLLAELGI